MQLVSELKTIGDDILKVITFIAVVCFVSSIGAFSSWKDDGLILEWSFSFIGLGIIIIGLLMLMGVKAKEIRKGQWLFLIGSLFVFVPGLFVDEYWILGAFFLLIAIINIVVIKVRNSSKSINPSDDSHRYIRRGNHDAKDVIRQKLTKEEADKQPKREVIFYSYRNPYTAAGASVENGLVDYWESASIEREVFNINLFELMTALQVRTLDELFVEMRRLGFDKFKDFLDEHGIKYGAFSW